MSVDVNVDQIDESIVTAGFVSNSVVTPDTSSHADLTEFDQGSGVLEPDSALVERDAAEEARVLATKTPISLLTEFLLRDKLKPEFIEIEKTGEAHSLTFTYRCTAGEYSADAVAKTVKNAKHLAARRVLEQMISAKPGDYTIYGIGEDQTLQFVRSMMPHLDDPTQPKVLNGMIQVPGVALSVKAHACVTVNYVGKLQEKCMQTWGAEFVPTYQTVDESGPPHDRLFTINCKVHTFVETASGKSVKAAKKACAEKMLIFLEKVPPGFLPMKTKAIAAGPPPSAETASTSNTGDANGASDPCVTVAAELASMNMAEPTSAPKPESSNPENSTISTLAEMDFDNESPSIKHQKLVAKIVKENGWKPIEYTPNEVDTESSEPFQCNVKINSDPPLSSSGVGSSAEKAKFASARSLLALIKETYCK